MAEPRRSSLSLAPFSPPLEESFAWCERLARTHYENFTVGSWFLPRGLKPHLFVLYAFARTADDLGDEAPGDRLAALDAFEEDLREALLGRPEGPLFTALAETVRRFDIPEEPFLRLIEANRMDRRRRRYETFEELRRYCAHSADPCGRLVLFLFGRREEELHRLSDATCTALQLTNFWQDVVRDLEMDRIYIPGEDLRRHGVTEENLRARRATEGFREMMRFEVGRTLELFAKGRPLADLVEPRLRRDLGLFTDGGLAILRRIERAGFDVLTRRPRLSRVAKAGLMLRRLWRG